MGFKKLIPSGRNLTVSMIILSLVAIFFIGYNFYYLPGNKDILHKNGFLILQKIQQNIKDRNDYLQSSFINILKGRKNEYSTEKTAPLQKKLGNYKIGGKIIARNYILPGRDADSSAIDEDSTVYLAGIYKDSLYYERSSYKKGWYQVAVPVQKFLEPLLTYQKSELFESYLVIGDSTGLIYSDPGIAINSAITEDSLIAKNSRVLFAGTKDLNISGTDYKMFYYPFQLGSGHFQLCGFLKEQTYSNKLRQVPVSFIYPIVIALLLIIMVLPIVKFYLIGKDEHVRYADFVFGLLSFFAGTAMLTLIIIQVLLLLAADLRTKKSLIGISAQIDNSFTTELAKVYKELNNLDSIVIDNPDSFAVGQMLLHRNFDATDQVKNYFKRCVNDTACYYNFNRISWIDAEGDQHIKADIDTAALVFANVKERGYFKALKKNEGYALPGKPSAVFVLEPIDSWTNGDFSIIMAVRSRLGNGSITALSVQMPSVMQTILPPGFGFCIIDNEGKVMLHSDMSRNLQENFVAKADPSRQIREAIKSRQESFFGSLNLYGKDNSLYIKPLAAMPFHLVTFYDNGYVVPVNMRIFTFALLFCFISSATCVLLWFGVFRKRNFHNPFLYDPLYYLKWVVPKERNVRFYILSIFFLVVYLAVQLSMIFSAKLFNISNYAVLILVMLLPVNIFAGLFVINYRVKRNQSAGRAGIKKDSRPYKALAVLFLQPLAVLIAYVFSISEGYGQQSAFLFFELFFFIFLCLFFLLPKGAFHFLYRSTVSYLSLYCWFSTLLLVCLSVLPAALYTWYAHNQEITQSVKKEQLYLANALQQRAVQTLSYTKKRSAFGLPENYFDRLQYGSGIYKIYGDTIFATTKIPRGDNPESYEKFYFSIANEIGNNYYDPLLIPALRDEATDHSWYWSAEKDSLLSFWYNLYTDPNKKDTGPGIAASSLEITSRYPERYEFVVVSFRGLLLLLVIAGFIYGLYLLLRFISGELFLRKFIPDAGEQSDSQPVKGIDTLLEEYKIFKMENDSPPGLLTKKDIDQLTDEYDFYKPVQDSKAAYRQEIAMIAAQAKFRDFYLFIWDRCSAREKYLLLDFAQQGFVNFKSTEVIHGLLQKGIFIILKEEVKLFSASFRSFVLTQKQNKEMIGLQKQFQQGSAWQTIRIPLLVILLGVAFFIFFTQEQTFQKVSALVAGISTIFSLLLKFFNDGAGLLSGKK